jgi:hypothetical protein
MVESGLQRLPSSVPRRTAMDVLPGERDCHPDQSLLSVPLKPAQTRTADRLPETCEICFFRMRQGNYRVDKGGGLAYRRAAAQAVGVSPASR